MFYEGVRKDRPNQQATYVWRAQCRHQVLHVIEKLYPYLIVKKRHADLIKEYCYDYISLLNFKKADEAIKYRELQRREDLYLKMKKLNAVGAAATTNSRSTREREVIV